MSWSSAPGKGKPVESISAEERMPIKAAEPGYSSPRIGTAPDLSGSGRRVWELTREAKAELVVSYCSNGCCVVLFT